MGWDAEEFKTIGVPFHERGRISDEYLAAIIELWTRDMPSFEGKYVSFKDVAFEPKPMQKPHLPIWIGGDADAALKRAARFGSGWWPFLTKPGDVRARLDFIKSQPTYKSGPFEALLPRGHVASRRGTRCDRRSQRTTWHERGRNHRSVRPVGVNGCDDERVARPAGEGRQRLPRLRAVGDRENQAQGVEPIRTRRAVRTPTSRKRKRGFAQRRTQGPGLKQSRQELGVALPKPSATTTPSPRTTPRHC